MRTQPIGVIDSGIGGLTVWRELVRILPHESMLYFGDSGGCPYGSKPTEQIARRVETIVDFLIANQCKLIVVACNAITASCIDFLRRHYAIPFVGMEPAVKPALQQTRTGAIGVLATWQTLNGKLFKQTREKYGQGVRVIEQVGHGLVESVEALDMDGPSAEALLRRHLQPMLENNIDILVLGCTHYPFMEPCMRRILGDNVSIFNPAPAVARHTARVLADRQLENRNARQPGRSVFYTTGNPSVIERVLAMAGDGDNHDVHAIDI